MLKIEQIQMVDCPSTETDELPPRPIYGWALVNDGVVQFVLPIVLDGGKMIVLPDARVSPVYA